MAQHYIRKIVPELHLSMSDVSDIPILTQSALMRRH